MSALDVRADLGCRRPARLQARRPERRTDLNDCLDHERRQLLRPFVLRSLGTAGDGRDPERREMCTQWLVDHLSDLFDRAGLTDRATELRELLPGDLSDENVRRVLRAAWEDAWTARRKALELMRERLADELRKRELPAVVAAAAVGSSGYWELRNAVYKAAYAKAREILAPTFDELLPSALELFDRMLPPEPLQPPVIENAELLFAAPGEDR